MSVTATRHLLARLSTRSALGTGSCRRFLAVPALQRTVEMRSYSTHNSDSHGQSGSSTDSGPKTESDPHESSGPRVNKGLLFGASVGMGLVSTVFIMMYRENIFGPGAAKTGAAFQPTQQDYQKVYDFLATLIEEKDDYEDGSYGPVILRLAWHASGTFDKASGTGGSSGATMRFAPESEHLANAGLKQAQLFLEPVKEKFPWISYSDLWILAGVCAIQEMQGPIIPWRPGRLDGDIKGCAPDGRLPDGAKGTKHLRDVFYRMGFNDQEIVALSGAHAVGRCHTDRSGFSGPWTFSPTVLTNDYFRLLVDEKWQLKQWDGPAQYEDKKTKSLMMLPTDMALVEDKSTKPHVETYAKDKDAFFRDFSAVIVKLFELGVPFKEGEAARMSLKPSWA